MDCETQYGRTQLEQIRQKLTERRAYKPKSSHYCATKSKDICLKIMREKPMDHLHKHNSQATAAGYFDTVC